MLKKVFYVFLILAGLKILAAVHFPLAGAILHLIGWVFNLVFGLLFLALVIGAYFRWVFPWPFGPMPARKS